MPRLEDIDTLLDPEEGSTPIGRLADNRNKRRFKTARNNDQKTLSKYLPNILTAFLPKPVVGPCDAFAAPLGLLKAVEEIARMPSPTPEASPIQFGILHCHLAANTKLLAEADYNMTKLLAQHQHTTLGFGSKFWPIKQLH
jgi:hypothetical protein